MRMQDKARSTKLLKKNQHGAYINGIFMVAGLSGSIILIQSFVPGAAAVLTQLNKLNSVTMPLRYLWVFVAYIALRKAADKFHPEYRFVKNQGIALTAGIWCFVVTAFCCIFGMYVEGDPASTALNVITFVLTALGPILSDHQEKRCCRLKKYLKKALCIRSSGSHRAFSFQTFISSIFS